MGLKKFNKKRGKLMNQQNLNQVVEQFRSGKMTEKEVIDEICKFVIMNYPIYGLHKYDEDFRQDILLKLIERGSHILHLFNPQYGDFFTFLFCYISTMINSKIKNRIMLSQREKLTVEESIRTFEEKEDKYYKIDFKNFDEPKVPFAARRIPSEELQKALQELSLKHKDKKVIILALKSSYYLTDEQILRICHIYDIEPDYFYSMVQHCKDTLENKSCKREKAQERRNFAYYHHKRYNSIIQNILEDEEPEYKFFKKEQYEIKEKKHRQNWKRLNMAFKKGHLYLRPTNKTVAKLMGICERQVNYYINCAKKEYEEKADAEENHDEEVKTENSETADCSEK